MLAAGGLLWTLLVLLTGGVSLQASGIPFSSRDPIRPLVFSAVCGLVAIVRHFGPGYRLSSRALATASALGTLGTAGLMLWLAIDRGAFVAGGADSSSYLSQTRLWQNGLPRVRQPLALEVPWPEADATLSPLGYCPCAKRDELVPIHPAGYPLVMAATRSLLGPGAEFWVVPVAAAGLVLCTYWLGATLWSGPVGFLAAVLLATSPPFVLQALQPMSDVPAAFWWTLALTLGLSHRRVSLVAAAAATGLAIATRPNLAPIGLLLSGLLFVIRRGRCADIRVHRLAWLSVCAGTIGGAVIVGLLNEALYGSPFNSGYGSLADLYALGHVLPNLTRYLSWLVGTETPLVAVVLISPLIASESGSAGHVRWYGLLLIVVALGSYLPWLVFDSWMFLRFLLVAYPLMYLLLASGVSVRGLADGWLRRSLPVVAFAVVGIAHAHGLVAREVLTTAAFEERYRSVGEYVSRMLPRDAVVLSMQHSGSVPYYSGRQILRYNYLDPAWLERAVQFFERKGRACYAVLEGWEVQDFRARFQAASRLGRLEEPPLAVIDGVSVFEFRLDE